MASSTSNLSRALAALAVVSIGSLPAVCGAVGGTIVFSGALSVGSYDTTISRAGTMAGVSGKDVRAVSARAAEIAFKSAGSGDRKSATVNAVGLGGMPLVTGCNGAGARMSAGGCRFGLDGGTLAVAAKDAPAAGRSSGVVVSVAYD